jgi:hypothetical protein
MLINGQSLPLQIVKLVTKEKALWEERQALVEKFESAENCGNADEMQRLGSEGAKLDRKINMFMLEKVTVFSMATSNNPNFLYN